MKRHVLWQYCQAIGTYEEWESYCGVSRLSCYLDYEGCNEVTKRHLIEDHYNICTKQVITCQYNSIGCNVKMKREDPEKHEEHDMKKHLEMAVQMIKQVQDIIKPVQKEAQEEIAANKVLILQLQDRLSFNNEQSSNTLSPNRRCQVIKFPKFVKHKDENIEWYSSGFYTSPGGYKICLSVYAKWLW